MSGVASNLPISSKNSRRRTATDSDLFSSVISSIDSSDEQANADKQEERPPVKAAELSCYKCFRKRNYRVTKSTSDISFKVNYFLTRRVFTSKCF